MKSRTARTTRFAFWASVTTVALALSILGRVVLEGNSVQPADAESSSLHAGTVSGNGPSRSAPVRRGLLVNDSRACPGYTLIAPMNSTTTYLLDLQGRVVKTWKSKYNAGQSAYLLENGHLLRAARLNPEEQIFGGNAQGGRVQEFNWDGELVWDFKFHDDRRLSHHDICGMPNGNVLLIVWEMKTSEEALAAGRNPSKVYGRWLADSVIEVHPTGKTTGEVVWEWHAWDHLIQDDDPSKATYGELAEHPELIDVNLGNDGFAFPGPVQRVEKKNGKEGSKKNRELEKLKSLGYVSSLAAAGNRWALPEWNHVNAVDYNAELDQIMLSPRYFSEVWIIDHSTTTAEAAGHKGGRSGKGGDLLYRWGNPGAYGAGTKVDQKLFFMHDAHWIPRGCPGAGHVLVFNNGGPPGGDFSSVDEFIPPVDSHGQYLRDPDAAFGPREAAWSYTAPKRADFFAAIMSGADRLPNGNTLICDSIRGMIFEVTPQKETVWVYVVSDKMGPPSDGPAGGVAIFRAYRYAPDYPGLAGKDLTPGNSLEPPAEKGPAKK